MGICTRCRLPADTPASASRCSAKYAHIACSFNERCKDSPQAGCGSLKILSQVCAHCVKSQCAVHRATAGANVFCNPLDFIAGSIFLCATTVERDRMHVC